MTFVLLIFSSSLFANSLRLTEAELIRISQGNSPKKQQMTIDARAKSLQLQQNQLQFQTRLNAQAGLTRSTEESLIQFQPTFGETNSFQFGIAKKTKSGVSFSTDIFGKQLSTIDKTTIDRATQAGLRISADIDLLSNWLGSKDDIEQSALKSALVNSKAMLKLNNHRFEYEIRQLYWQIVANLEREKITLQLLGTAKEQLSDLRKRNKMSVASPGDVARAQAQVQSRKTALLLIKYERIQLIKNLKNILPVLQDKEIDFSNYDYVAVSKDVAMCIETLRGQTEFKKSWSSIGPILDTLNKKFNDDQQNIDRLAAPDLKLRAEYQLTNSDNNYGQAFKDEKKDGYGAMLMLSIPLGSTDNRVREAQRALIESQYAAESKQLTSQLNSEFKQINSSLEVLVSGLSALENNNKLLRISLNDMKKKYRQARANMTQLIYEQESYFSSATREIDVRLQVMLALLDYFKTFDKFPCKVNHAGAPS